MSQNPFSKNLNPTVTLYISRQTDLGFDKSIEFKICVSHLDTVLHVWDVLTYLHHVTEYQVPLTARIIGNIGNIPETSVRNMLNSYEPLAQVAFYYNHILDHKFSRMGRQEKLNTIRKLREGYQSTYDHLPSLELNLDRFKRDLNIGQCDFEQRTVYKGFCDIVATAREAVNQ